MEKEELLKNFLGAFPESSHPLDTRRFVAYAVQCAIEQDSIDEKLIGQKVSQERLNCLNTAYSWIRETVDYIRENKDVFGNEIS